MCCACPHRLESSFQTSQPRTALFVCVGGMLGCGPSLHMCWCRDSGPAFSQVCLRGRASLPQDLQGFHHYSRRIYLVYNSPRPHSVASVYSIMLYPIEKSFRTNMESKCFLFSIPKLQVIPFCLVSTDTASVMALAGWLACYACMTC